jgi:hypothetical protein
MYLTAQRVRAPSGQKGINAFFYLHRRAWLDEPPPEVLPEHNPGELLHKQIEIYPPSGNRVLSYLDIVAPDGTPSTQIIRWSRDLLCRPEELALPWSVVVGDCLIRFDLGESMLPTWNIELGELLRAALRVHRSAGLL